MKKIEVLSLEKVRILKAFLGCAQKYRERLSPQSETAQRASLDEKLDWIDTLSDDRELHFKTLQLIDQQIEAEKVLLKPEGMEKLHGESSFQFTTEQILCLSKEIQLTDQSLFLYINHIGFAVRAQILKGLKEKEAISKFKSQNQAPVGEGFDKKV